MKFTRTVSCPDEFCGDSPDVLVVEIDAERARWIHEMSAEVRRLKVHAVEIFDYSAAWYLPDWDQNEDEDGTPAPGEEYTSLDLHMLHVSDDDFWWTANLEGTGVVLSCEPILISELSE